MKLIYEKELPQKIDRVRCIQTEEEHMIYGEHISTTPTRIEIKTGEFETFSFVYLTHLINAVKKFHRIIIE